MTDVKPKLLNGTVTSEEQVRASVSRGADGYTTSPNRLYGSVDDENRRPLISLWLKNANQLNEVGKPTSFGHMRWSVPLNGRICELSVMIDRVTAKFLKQSQYGPVIEAAADGSLHVRAIELYDGCEAFADFMCREKEGDLETARTAAGAKRAR